jgi:hypothetical protein
VGEAAQIPPWPLRSAANLPHLLTERAMMG